GVLPRSPGAPFFVTLRPLSRYSGESERSTLPDGPDTEPSELLSETMSVESEDISVRLESSAEPTPRTKVNEPAARSLARTARSAENETAFSPPTGQNSNTTQQSMQKPDIKVS